MKIVIYSNSFSLDSTMNRSNCFATKEAKKTCLSICFLNLFHYFSRKWTRWKIHTWRMFLIIFNDVFLLILYLQWKYNSVAEKFICWSCFKLSASASDEFKIRIWFKKQCVSTRNITIIIMFHCLNIIGERETGWRCFKTHNWKQKTKWISWFKW